MGMSAGKKGSQQTEINVTPLVDVVLVLLIIFMVVAPLLATNIPIRIPEQQTEDIPIDVQPDNKQIVLQLRKDPSGDVEDTAGNKVLITINDAPVPKAQLADQLKKFYSGRKDKILFFDAKDDVPYGPAVEVMDIVRDQGLILGVAPNAIETK